ncbi:MAG: GIY-YIG nuclease family protein [Candidatus Omnitrophica bacterium]|nr:GIY-YIG nuclease family protein [Candidatus Omnitrophota bacterium]
MKYYVYVLRSKKDGKRYIGFTNNIKRRINQHNTGMVLSTKTRIPFELKYVEEFLNRSAARDREKYFKTAAGRRFLGKLYKSAGGGMADTYV